MSAKRKRSTDDIGGEVDRKILMAVDFGTTASKAMWAQSRKPDTQALINQWPEYEGQSRFGITCEKVPTEVVYDGNNVHWGFMIPDGSQPLQWFKLGLDPSHDRGTALAKQYPDARAAPPAYNSIPAVKVCTDFLTCLREHLESELARKLPKGALMSTAIEYIITVPAVWTDAAKARTRECAEKAGMGKGSELHIISEPEAAGIHALSTLDHLDLEVEDTCLVADCGGGTCDMICYTVTALKPNVEVAEASPGTGSLCGGSFLNRGFHKLLEDKFGHLKGWNNEILEEAMKFFEDRIKTRFHGTFAESFTVPLHGLADDPAMGIKRGRLTIHGDELRHIFEPVLKEVLKLVVNQIKASKQKVKAVLLVGGFGSNAYLRDSIELEVKSYNVQVIQVENGLTSVVRGALMKGLASTSPSFATVRVSGRRARKHYGLLAGLAYDAAIHDMTQRYWNGYYGCWRVSCLDWFIKKGEIVEKDKPVRLEYLQSHEVSEGPPKSIVVNIQASSDPKGTGGPKYKGDAGYSKLVTLTADLSRIPTSGIPQVVGKDGIRYYDISLDIQVTYYSAYTTYELIHGGVNYGLVSSEYV